MRVLSWIALPLLVHLFLAANALVFAAPATPAVTSQADTTSLQQHFDWAYSAYDAGEYELSLDFLQRVVDQDASFTDRDRGPAVYWYGRALEAMDRRSMALAVWNEGLQSLDRFSLELADAFLRGVFEENEWSHYARASEYYLRILRHLGEPLSEQEEAVLRTHLAELCLILPEEVTASVGLSDCDEDMDLSQLAADAGEQLITWWNRENVIFATERNERLEEHLERIGQAREEYWYQNAYDDRGRTFIRYGPPERQVTIRFDDIRDLHRIPGLSSLVGRSFDGTRNEFWIYPEVDRAAHFLFIHDRDGAYRLAEANELIPSGLRGGSRRAPEAVHVMEHVYRQLALYHIDYSTIYGDVTNYADELAFAEMGAGRPSRPPASFVQSTIGHARNEDRQIDRRRNERLPESATNLHRYTEPLDLAVRTFRFLEDDGTTRADIYWAATFRDLHPNRRTRRMLRRAELPGETDSYVIEGTVVTFNEDHSTNQEDQGQHLIPLEDDSEDTDRLAPVIYSMRMDSSPVDMGLQWDQYVVIRNERTDALQLGPQIKVQQIRFDSLEALTADPARLEMSDLMPLSLPDDEMVMLEETPAEHVYPYAEIASDTELALYFEVYHLEPGDDGQHHFSVEYEITRQPFARLQDLVRGDRTDRTTVRSDYVSDEPTAREHLALDLIDDDFLGTVIISVRVRDEVSGEEVERALPFSVIDPTRPSRRW